MARTGIETGLVHLFLRHTSASLVVTENADPAVLDDLDHYMGRLVTDGDSRYRHHSEGPDDMAAHIRSVLTQNSLSLPVSDNQLALGVWQGIFIWEHRYHGQRRRLIVTLHGNGNASSSSRTGY